MTRAHQHVLLRLLLQAAAFLGALTLTTGCSTLFHPVAVVPEPAPLPAVKPASPLVHVAADLDTAGLPSHATSTAFQRHTTSSDGRDTDVTVDPTGKFIAFSSTRHADHTDIYLQKVDGVSVVRLTDDPADDAFPTFSPDAKTIAFSSNRTGSWNIYTMDTDGRHVTQITTGHSQDVHPTFSPDGTHLAYASLSPKSQSWEIWVVNLSTNEKRIIGPGLFPVWSPDKSVDRIAFQRASDRGDRFYSLWTLDLIDGEAHRLTEVASNPDGAVISPTWSPDGSKLAFATIHQSQRDIWTVDLDGKNRQRLTDGATANMSPVWAVNNRVYFVSDRESSGSIWSVNASPDSPAVAAKPALQHEPAPEHHAAVPVAPAAQPAPAEAKAETTEVAH